MSRKMKLAVCVIVLQIAVLMCSFVGLAELETTLVENRMYVASSEGEIIYPLSENWYQVEEIQPATYRIITWIDGEGERCALYNGHTGMQTGFIYWQAYGADRENDPILVLDETGYYYIDIHGEPISSQRYYHGQPFSCGLAWTVKAVDQDGMPIKELSGFINIEGECVIPGDKVYPYDEFFTDDRCLVYDHESGKYGYMNPAGEMCVPAIYDFAEAFCGGFAYVELDGEAYFIDTNGEKAK